MKLNWHELLKKPLWMRWASLSVLLLFYYLLIILPLNALLVNTQKTIQHDKSNIKWMRRATEEIIRLQKVIPHEKGTKNVSAFALVTQAINNIQWTDLVNNVHQLDEHRVQVNFQTIPYNQLVNWLQTLDDESGIYVMEASLEKIQPDVVSASLILQKK